MRKQKTPKGDSFEGNRYDKIFKENLEKLLPAFLHKIVGLSDFELQNLPRLKLQTTLEKEPDFLKKILLKKSGEAFIQHLEFETSDKKDFDARMLLYLAIIFRIHGLDVRQHVIYLGNGRPQNMSGQLKFSQSHFQYKIHCISDFSYKEFLQSDVPEEVLLTILANPEGQSAVSIIRMTLSKLQHLSTKDSSDLKRFLNQLKMLSFLRNLRTETVKQINDMSRWITKEMIESDGLYQQGIEKGIEKKAISTILNCLREKISIEKIAVISAKPKPFVLSIKKQLAKEKEIAVALREGKEIKAVAAQLEVSELLVEVIKEELDRRTEN